MYGTWKSTTCLISITIILKVCYPIAGSAHRGSHGKTARGFSTFFGDSIKKVEDGVMGKVPGVVEAITGTPKKECFGGLGCFDNKSPWFSPMRPFPLPMSPDEIKTEFFLITRDLPDAVQIQKRPINLGRSGYDANKWTVFIIHGFAANSTSPPWIIDLVRGYLKNVDANVFLVDWGSGSKMINYLQAASNIRVVGAELARLSKHLVSTYGQSPRKIHCMGHSLGAHTCGYMGKAMVAKDMKIDWITGLDPAGPGFELTDSITRLSPDDAHFVDAYHTDAKPLIPFLGFGMMGVTAHVDFYMNGGSLQPGCTVPTDLPIITSINDLISITVEKIKGWIACPHIRAPQYYASSLNGCVFFGSRYKFANMFTAPITGHRSPDCDTESGKCQIVGLLARASPGRGSFNVYTSGEKPYCLPLGKSDKSWLSTTVEGIEHCFKKLGLTIKNAVKTPLDAIRVTGNKVKDTVGNILKGALKGIGKIVG